jgi:hypothetical protein
MLIDGLTAREAFSFDLVYVDMTEGLAESKKDKVPFETRQLSSLSLLGYKVLPVFGSPRPNEVGHCCEARLTCCSQLS